MQDHLSPAAILWLTTLEKTGAGKYKPDDISRDELNRMLGAGLINHRSDVFWATDTGELFANSCGAAVAKSVELGRMTATKRIADMVFNRGTARSQEAQALFDQGGRKNKSAANDKLIAATELVQTATAILESDKVSQAMAQFETMMGDLFNERH